MPDINNILSTSYHIYPLPHHSTQGSRLNDRHTHTRIHTATYYSVGKLQITYHYRYNVFHFPFLRSRRLRRLFCCAHICTHCAGWLPAVIRTQTYTHAAKAAGPIKKIRRTGQANQDNAKKQQQLVHHHHHRRSSGCTCPLPRSPIPFYSKRMRKNIIIISNDINLQSEVDSFFVIYAYESQRWDNGVPHTTHTHTIITLFSVKSVVASHSR